MSILKRFKKSIIAILGVIVLILIINSVVSSLIENKISDFVSNNTTHFDIRVDKPAFKLLRRTVVLNNIEIAKKTNMSSDTLKKAKPKLEHVSISSLKLKGIGILRILFNDKILINTLEVNDLFLISSNKQIEKKDSANKNKLSIDSIPLKKLKGIEIDHIVFNDFVFNQIDEVSSAVILENEPLNFKIGGFKLEEQTQEIYRIVPVEKAIQLEDLNIKMNDSKYDLGLEKLYVRFKDKIISIEGFSVHPQIPKEKLAKSYTFTKDVVDLDIELLNVYNLNLTSLIKKEGIYLDSVLVSNLDLSLYKDKRKPFNTNEYKTLPHIALHKATTPIHISKMHVSESRINIQEQLKKADTLMSIYFDNTELLIKDINTTEIEIEKPMQVSLNANVMGKAPLRFQAKFPTGGSTFYFNGALGEANFSLFDSALFPAVGLKVLSGKLNGLNFNGSANNMMSNGEMTMLYDNLEAKVFKNHTLEINKTLSWTVNAIIKKSNTNINGNARVAVMHYERDTYKGLGNYLWKTVFSGVANTLSPVGKHVKRKKKK